MEEKVRQWTVCSAARRLAGKIGHELLGGDTDGFDAFSPAVHAKHGAHVLLTHQRLKRQHTAADVETDEHASEIEDINWHRDGIIRLERRD